MAKRLPVHGLDPADGVDGQVPILDGGKFVIGDIAAGSGGSFDGSAGRAPRLVPFGVKLRGGNIVPQNANSNPWSYLYANWSTTWATIVKPQINALASVGGNAVRLIGDVGGVHTGALTQAALVAAYEQYVDYCANLGLYVYACLSDAGHWDGATKDQALAIMGPVCDMLDEKPNVIGIDVVQEIGLVPSLYSGTLHDFLAYLFTDLRTHTSLPMTASSLHSSNNSTAQWSSTTTAAVADVVDFYDFHPYYSALAPADVAAFTTANTAGLPMLLGEWGATTASGLTYHQNAVAVEALSTCAGGFIWSIVDNASSVDWALFTWSTYAPRTSLVNVFRTAPDHTGALPESGPQVQDEGTSLPMRGRVNFVGAGVTAADDATNDATTVTVPGGSLTIQDENVTVATGVTQIDFQGAGVTAASGSGEVVVTIAGGSSSTGELLMQDGVTAPPVPIETEARDDWLYQG